MVFQKACIQVGGVQADQVGQSPARREVQEQGGIAELRVQVQQDGRLAGLGGQGGGEVDGQCRTPYSWRTAAATAA